MFANAFLQVAPRPDPVESKLRQPSGNLHFKASLNQKILKENMSWKAEVHSCLPWILDGPGNWSSRATRLPASSWTTPRSNLPGCQQDRMIQRSLNHWIGCILGWEIPWKNQPQHHLLRSRQGFCQALVSSEQTKRCRAKTAKQHGSEPSPGRCVQFDSLRWYVLSGWPTSDLPKAGYLKPNPGHLQHGFNVAGVSPCGQQKVQPKNKKYSSLFIAKRPLQGFQHQHSLTPSIWRALTSTLNPKTWMGKRACHKTPSKKLFGQCKCWVLGKIYLPVKFQTLSDKSLTLMRHLAFLWETTASTGSGAMI